jgi:hypothetical protein
MVVIMRKFVSSGILLCAALVSANADAAFLMVTAYSDAARVQYVVNGTNRNDYVDFVVKNGYVSIYARDNYSNANFSCTVWYTSSAFASIKETALALMSLKGPDVLMQAYFTRDAAGTCTDIHYSTRWRGPGTWTN